MSKHVKNLRTEVIHAITCGVDYSDDIANGCETPMDVVRAAADHLAEVERQNRLMRKALKELSALPFRAPKDVMAGARRKEIAADALAQLRKRKAAK